MRSSRRSGSQESVGGSVSGCWIPTQKPRPADGYVQRTCKKQKISLHRLMYETLVGPIPEGLVIDHLCRERSCCNPEHLEVVTQQENICRGEIGRNSGQYNRSKTHCPQGHEYDEANTCHSHQGGYIGRHCRQCGKARQRANRERLKQNV